MKRTGHRLCSPGKVKAYFQADIDAAMDVVIRLSDNDRYDGKKFIREVIRKLKPWGTDDHSF
jgi:hypothetical protein